MTELEKLEWKRTEMKEEIRSLRPQQAQNRLLIPKVIRLSIMLADCEKMIAEARVNKQASNKIGRY